MASPILPGFGVVNETSSNTPILPGFGALAEGAGGGADATSPTWGGGAALTISNVARTGVDLSWPAASDNIAVTQYRWRANGGSWNVLGNVTSTSPSGLTRGTAYTFDVQAGDAADNWSSSLSASTTTKQAYAQVTLQNVSAVVQSGLTGLKWAWFDQTTPDALTSAVDKGTGETTDGFGVLAIPLPNSAKTSGQTGWLIVSDSDGTAAMQHKAFCGPVDVVDL